MGTITPLKSFTDNYIWSIKNDSNDEMYVVDPGCAETVIHYCTTNQIDLTGILVTHHHQDHIGGVDKLIDIFGPLPIYGPISIQQVTCPCFDEDQFSCSIGNFEVISVPGHTLDHIAFFSGSLLSRAILFVGDCLFSSGCGRVFEGTYETMFQSLQKLKTRLPDETLVFCAHEYTKHNIEFALTIEPHNVALQKRSQEVDMMIKNGLPTVPSSMHLELQVNPFLRTHVSTLQQQICHLTQQAELSEEEIFTILRKWKDQF